MAERVHSSSSTSTTASGSENNEEYPTRFRFYEPQIIKLDEVDRNPNRFSFYDTRQELAAVENIPQEDSTEDILRSLQETEVQRLSILNTDPMVSVVPSQLSTTAGSNQERGDMNTNPYEDAIKEALELLRKHRSPPVTPNVSSAPPITVNVKTNTSAADADDRARTPRDQDRLLQHRMDDDDDVDLALLDATLPASAESPEKLAGAYEEHKLKAKQRQERMAQYASRLEEFKNSLPAVTQREVEDKLPQSHSGDYSDLSHSTKEQVEAEVQRGVERVLLAILERANASRERSIQASLSDDNTSSHGGEMSDVLIRVMDELGLNSSDSREQLSNIKSKTSGETDRTGLGSRRSAGTSVVDELLAEDEDDDIIEHDEGFNNKTSQSSLAVMSSPPAHSSMHPHFSNAWGPREEKKLPDSQEKVNNNNNNHVLTYNSTEEVDEDDEDCDVDRLMDECLLSHSDDVVPVDNHHHGDVYHDEISQEGHKQLQGVLGPLSKDGNITGVVLDLDGEDSVKASSKQKEMEHSSSSSKYKSQFATGTNYNIGSSSATLDDDGDDDVVEEDSMDSRSKPQEEEYSNGQHTNDIQEEDGSNSHADDFEAAELMRTLCAHFLPFGVDKRFNRLIESIPEWDETNPNEAGYRIIRLSRVQLQRVELAFERMINRLKQKSEQQLGELAGDAQFARELLEAERLLDESEERRLTTVDSAKSQKDSIKSSATSAAGDFIVTGDSGSRDKQELSFVLDEEEDCHPNFPGVKAIGKGEMGDLEYFHLPIIFKSHVTGFEPTKDLVLEPGNIVAGQYLVESELGSAAFSTAYRCIDLSTEGEDGHEEVCLKVIKNTKDFFDQSLDEIKILELLRQTGKVHENYIVEMKCFFYYREHLIIVTELLRQNLFEFGKFITDNSEEPYFTISRLAYITRQALISLRFVHSLGLVHSDVKPENMLLSSYSRAQIKLIDFGSSCYLTDRQSSYIQSRSYRAPEVILGLPYDGKIDVWSLGCVVAEMFTGEVTFQNDSIVSMLSRIEAICGPFPRHMIAQGRQSGRFFTKSGLLYEVVDSSDRGDENKSAPGPHDDDDDDEEEFHTAMQFDIFQPKNTRLCCRLGFDADLMDDFDQETCTSKSRDPERHHQQLFTDFVRQLLTIDPDGRPTASQALQHPWMRYAATLSEEAVKYPSS